MMRHPLRAPWSAGLPRLALLLSLLLAGAVSAAHGKVQLESAWLSDELSIDGDTRDWEGALALLEDQGLVIGVRNDGKHLYLCLASGQSEFARKAVGLGLILQVGPKGAEPLEIRFPVGRMGSGPPPDLDIEGRRGGGEIPLELWERALATFQVRRPGRAEYETLDAKSGLGIEIGASRYGSGFAFELKVPLRSSADEPYAVGAESGAKLALSVDTPKPDREAMRQAMAGRGGATGHGGASGDPSGMGGMGGMGGGGGMDGGMGGGMGDVRDGLPQDGPVPVRVRARVLLAAGGDEER